MSRVRMRPAPGPLSSIAAAVVAGLALAAAFQPLNWWPLALPGVALALSSVRGGPLGQAFTLGFVTGAIFFALHIQWITVYLGPLPLVGLTAIMAVWFGLGQMLTALAWRFGERRWRGPWGSLLALPAVLAGIWTIREGVSATWPWGGFSWGRIAFSQASSPVGDAASWVGAGGLTFLIALVAAVVLQLVHARSIMARRRLTIGAIATLALVAIPLFPVQQSGHVRVGAVQGDSEAGLLAEYTFGEIITQHADATAPLDGERMDVLVWPENAGEWNPAQYPDHVALLDAVTGAVDAPLVLGAITNEHDTTYNSLLLWRNGVGPTADYHKRHPVPFAEYIPAREFFLPLLESLGFADLIPRDYGLDPTSANVFDIDGTKYGLAICFDIIDDALIREMIQERGAGIILAPSNNADFGEGSAENVQQLAIAQLRAIEAGRAVVNISTVGTSAMILPDGRMVSRLAQYEPGAMLEDLPVSTTITPGIAAGAWIEWGVGLGALLTLAALIATDRRSTRRTAPGRDPRG